MVLNPASRARTQYFLNLPLTSIKVKQSVMKQVIAKYPTENVGAGGSRGFSYKQVQLSQILRLEYTCVLCCSKRELFVYPAMFPHLPEHLASRYVIIYACVTMVLDYNGPIIQIFKSMSLKQKQTA